MITDKEQSFIETYLTTRTITECCKKLGIARKTAYNYLDNPEVKEILRDRKLEVMKETSLFMEQSIRKATESLVNIITDKTTPQSVRVQAINSLFSNYQKLTETLDLELEIDKMKEKFERFMNKQD